MSSATIETRRPERWDYPLAPDLSESQVAWLLKQHPFCDMDRERFARTVPLDDIVRHDCRLLHLESGDVIFREGQYGGTAYLILDGRVQILLSHLATRQEVQQSRRRRRSSCVKRLLRQLLTPAPTVERRNHPRHASAPKTRQSDAPGAAVACRGEGKQTRLYLQDVPGTLENHEHTSIEVGEMFGEMAAVTRTPRDFTAIAETPSQVLEIRWQGLKLLRQDPAFRQLLDERYRRELLGKHLKETPLFRYIPPNHLQRVIQSVRFEQFGDLEWYAQYRKTATKMPAATAAEDIAAEPLIAEEGSYAASLWIVRSGFARLSRKQGAGHRTLAYLGKGQMFGLEELSHNVRSAGQNPPLPYQHSLRAVGYVDLLRIAKPIFQEHVVPFIRATDLPAEIALPRYQFGQPVIDAPFEESEHGIETGLLEFLVERRLINGHQTMVIDTERCTRCDDCVRACAQTHGGTPVFSREGPQYGPWMFAQACMHCEDPVCMIGCPTGAIHRDPASGLVKISEETCIGCKTCAESCPYDNIRMVVSSDQRGRAKLDEATGLPILQASKCDMCSETSSGRPACLNACPHDALVRLDMTDVSRVSQHMQRRAS